MLLRLKSFFVVTLFSDMGVTEQIEDLLMECCSKSTDIQNRVSFILFILNVAIQILRLKCYGSNVMIQMLLANLTITQHDPLL